MTNVVLDNNLPCVVLGSAPNPHPPRTLKGKYNLVCVNCSGHIAKEYNLGDPVLTISWVGLLLFEKNKIHRVLLKDLITDKLIILVNHKKFKISKKEVKERLSSVGYQYNHIKIIDIEQREDIVASIIGKENEASKEACKVSTGLFAVCYALYHGISDVIISGISISKPGHAYSNENYPKWVGHIFADREALVKMRKKRLPVKTTESELAEETGLELVEIAEEKIKQVENRDDIPS